MKYKGQGDCDDGHGRKLPNHPLSIVGCRLILPAVDDHYLAVHEPEDACESTGDSKADTVLSKIRKLFAVEDKGHDQAQGRNSDQKQGDVIKSQVFLCAAEQILEVHFPLHIREEPDLVSGVYLLRSGVVRLQEDIFMARQIPEVNSKLLRKLRFIHPVGHLKI